MIGKLVAMKMCVLITVLLAGLLTVSPASAQLPAGTPAPAFTLKDINGNDVSLSDFNGKVTLLFIFGYGCPFCISDGPFIEALWQKYKNQNFQLVGIDAWNGSVAQIVTIFQSQTQASYPLLQQGASLQSAYKTSYDWFILLDQNHNIIGSQPGGLWGGGSPATVAAILDVNIQQALDAAPAANTAPSAVFTVSPTSADAGAVFSVDAFGVSDTEDGAANLEVRWDWTGDGVWDTEYSTTKSAAFQFMTPGEFTIILEVKDTGGLTTTSVRTITVLQVINQPVVSNVTLNTDEDVAVILRALTHVVEPGGDQVTLVSVTQGANGTVEIQTGDTIVYTPAANFHGTDQFTFVVANETGGRDTAEVTITIQSVFDGPISAPSNLQAVDRADDNGSLITLRFIASDHHPGASAGLGETDPLEFYYVYEGLTADAASAVVVDTLDAGFLAVGAGDSVSATVKSAGVNTVRYYWIQAVAGTEQSPLIGPNLAQAIDNTNAGAGDLNANGVIDIADVAVIARIFGDASEYDPAVDLNMNGVIDIGDVAVIAQSFGQTVSKPVAAAPQALLQR